MIDHGVRAARETNLAGVGAAPHSPGRRTRTSRRRATTRNPEPDARVKSRRPTPADQRRSPRRKRLTPDDIHSRQKFTPRRRPSSGHRVAFARFRKVPLARRPFPRQWRERGGTTPCHSRVPDPRPPALVKKTPPASLIVRRRRMRLCRRRARVLASRRSVRWGEAARSTRQLRPDQTMRIRATSQSSEHGFA